MARQYHVIRCKLNNFVLTADPHSNKVVNSSRNHPLTRNQLWLLELQTDGTYYIVSKLNGKVLDSSGGGLQVGEDMILSDRYAGGNQRWRYKGLQIVSARNEDLVLDLCEASRAQNVRIILFRKKSILNNSNQEFDFEKVFVSVYIQSHLTKFLLGINDSHQEDTATVTVSAASNPLSANQLWHFDVQPNASFLIVSELDGRVLDCEAGTSDTKLRVCRLRPPNSRQKQLWRMEGGAVVSAQSNSVLSIQNGSAWPHAPVVIQPRANPLPEWQKFEFIEV